MRLGIQSTQNWIRENVTYERNDADKRKQMAQKDDKKQQKTKNKKIWI